MFTRQRLPVYSLAPEDVRILASAKEYKDTLLSLIKSAKKRIYITALYLQEDDAGTEILTALHQAALANPDLKIVICVDYHRAQRGLIGAKQSLGNAAFYQKLKEQFGSQVAIYGVPVKAKELFGVLHIKGFVFDDTLLYSGASINDVYLHEKEKYRLDRYFLVNSQAVCNEFVDFTENELINSDAVPRLDIAPVPKLTSFKAAHRQLVRRLKRFNFKGGEENPSQALNVRLLLGLGPRGNQLNRAIKTLFTNTRRELVLYTPYFNFPTPLLRALRKTLRQGRKVTIVVGDKTANDFYSPPSEPFSKISALPYLYETILHRFLKSQQKAIEEGKLNVYLWKDGNNSFHLKGICSDDRYHLLSGHNLNPRAWGLDIENGILFDDNMGTLREAIKDEREAILAHCTRLNSHTELESIADYPAEVQKLLGQAKRVKVDFIVKRFI